MTAEKQAGRCMNQATRREHLKGSIAKKGVWSGLHMCIKGTGLNHVINSLSFSEVQVLLLSQVCAMVAGGGCELLRGQ